MNRARLLLSASITLGIATAIGCSSSSSSPDSRDGGGSPRGGDAAALDGSTDADDGAVGARCNPFLNTLCPSGQTCCFSGLQGTCAPFGSCHTAFQISCTSQANCPGGEACCGSGPGTNLALFCASACGADEFQLCRSGHECPAGTACVFVARGATTMICRALPDAGPLNDDSGDDAGVSDASGPINSTTNTAPNATYTDGAGSVGDAAAGG